MGCESALDGLLLALMKVLCCRDFFSSRRISMAVISLESIDLCRCGICFNSILLEEELRANGTFSKEVDIVEDRAIIESVARFSSCSTRATGVKVLVGCQGIDVAVAQPFKVVDT